VHLPGSVDLVQTPGHEVGCHEQVCNLSARGGRKRRTSIYVRERYYLQMAKTIVAVYKDGVFKPLQKIDIPEHKHVHLVVIPEGDADLLESQRKELSSIIGIGDSGISDVSRRHDHYLYEG
jgi:predicted DNA-binding antitoxin AbrB/MazE fold protein